MYTAIFICTGLNFKFCMVIITFYGVLTMDYIDINIISVMEINASQDKSFDLPRYVILFRIYA